MSLSKFELALLLWKRKGRKIVNLSKRDLQKEIDDSSPAKDEDILIESWKSSDILAPALEDFSTEDLRSYLQIKYRKTFPFASTLFLDNDGYRQTLLWWFSKETAFVASDDVPRYIVPLNQAQEKIIENIGSSKRHKTLLQIVNAGPGTGKTTAANRLAYSLREEGVLLISYTNDSIRENYQRFFEYPLARKIVGLKKYNADTLINIITVDSLAARILGSSSDNQFDQSIKTAARNIDPFKFLHRQRRLFYNHVVVDECQDIDEIRGYLILKFCETLGIKTLSLFGDPRQRIRSNCGKWYSSLWDKTFDYRSNQCDSEAFEPVFYVSLTETYRYENNAMTDLVNSLSARRENLHVSLESKVVRDNFPPIKIVSLEHLMEKEFLNNLIQNNGSNSAAQQANSVAILGPSIIAENNTSNMGKSIAKLFRYHNFPLYFKNEGAFIPDAFPFLTIHSSKGREFDYVFIYGMDGYPYNFSMIPYEEAESLIFVAHSRARKAIYYIAPQKRESPFVLPRGVPNEMIDPLSEKNTSDLPITLIENNEETMRHQTVTSLLEDHNFFRFLEANRYFPILGEPCSLKDWEIYEMPDHFKQKEFLPVWGFIVAFDFQAQLTSLRIIFNRFFKDLIDGNYVVLSPMVSIRAQMEGKIVDGREVSSGRKVLSHEISPTDKILLEETYNILDTFELHGKRSSPYTCAYNRLYGNICNFYYRYLMDDGLTHNHKEADFTSFFEKSVSFLVKSKIALETFGKGEVEVSTTDPGFSFLHGRIDYVDSDRNIIEFKNGSLAKEYSTLLQAWIYYVLLYAEGKNPVAAYTFDLKKGILYEVTSNQHVSRWQHIIRNYFQLAHHVSLVQKRLTMARDDPRTPPEYLKRLSSHLPDNIYTVDTEFYEGSIFDISIVNISDPYRTVIDLLLPATFDGLVFALQWLPETKADMYNSTIKTVNSSFRLLHDRSTNSSNPPTLAYYIASQDVDWCQYPSINRLNLCSSARREAENKGSFTGGNFGPKLGELYTNLAPFPLEYQSHLHAHTSLTDALLLYELLVLRLLEP